MKVEPVVWRDGSLIEYSSATAHVMSHMSARGSQVFDVMAVVETDAGPCGFGLRQHVARFTRSMEMMSMTDTPSVAAVEAAVAQTVAANCVGADAALPDGPWMIKMIAAWDAEGGILPDSFTPTIYIVASSAASSSKLGGVANPVTAKTAAMPKMPADVLPPSLKVAAGYTPALRHWIRARSEGFDQVVFKDVDGYLAESVASSLLVVADGKIVAPPLDTVLDGITRRAVLDAAAFLDIPVDIRPVRWHEVLEADELFLTSTTKTVLPIGRLDNVTLSAPGPITLKVGDVTGATLAGRHELGDRWLTPLT